MSTPTRYEAGTPLARQEFAQRLRDLRVPRGFRTARSLARALDIDENRYTRYERAEVEPDLTMIRRICETLDVTPDALLGSAISRDASASENQETASDENSSIGVTDLQTSAWLLAEVTTDLLDATAGSAAAPLVPVTETCKTYRALIERPFETIAELMSQVDASRLEASTAQQLRASIDRFLGHIKSRS